MLGLAEKVEFAAISVQARRGCIDILLVAAWAESVVKAAFRVFSLHSPRKMHGFWSFSGKTLALKMSHHMPRSLICKALQLVQQVLLVKRCQAVAKQLAGSMFIAWFQGAVFAVFPTFTKHLFRAKESCHEEKNFCGWNRIHQSA